MTQCRFFSREGVVLIGMFLKPTPAVEFVVLNLVVLRTGASFSAEEVLAAGGVVTSQTSA